MTRKDFRVIAQLIATLSFSFKDGCFIIGDGGAYDALLIEEMHDTVDAMLKQQNKNYSPEKFWNAVYKHRQAIINAINNN